MSGWFDQLASSIQQAGQQVRAWEAGDGRLLITPFAARLLACELPGVEGNLFWHDPAIEDAAAAKEKLDPATGGGPIGGDRLWIAPEVAFMWRDLAKARIDPFADYQLHPAMDPGDYRVVLDEPDCFRSVAEMALTDHRRGATIDLRATRQFRLIDSPDDLPAGLKGVSFAIDNELTCLGGDDGAVAGAWDILQIPAEGQLVCPTLAPDTAARSYYESFGDKHVISDQESVRFLVDGHRQVKMGLSPTQTTGRMGFHRRVGGGSTLIVRIFAPLPGEPYVDLPRASDDTVGGDALQAYNDNGMFGGFGEMEFHDPALIVGRPPETRRGSCVTHVLAGEDGAIRVAARLLLGVEI